MATKKKIDRSKLLSVLWEIQRKKRHIAHDDITKIAKEFELSRMEVEGVLTFYHFFHRQDCGKYTIYLNNSITSEHAGMDKIREAFEKEIGVPLGHLSFDGLFGLYETACIGLSDQEPACLINFKPFTNLTPEKARDIIHQLRNGAKPSEICDKPNSKIHYTPPPEKTVFFKSYNKFSVLNYIREHKPEEILEIIKKSKLSGMGGAFFPTGLKWQFARQNKADIKYLICNADEGEPGTFKDRVLLQTHPELLIEGMILAAYAIGASQGIIYLRGEYRYLKEALEDLIESYKTYNFLGNNIPAKEPLNFDIYIELGAGAYVCGEETALIHSAEGFRGEPSTKVVYPVQSGFKGKPTVVNNVETLCAVTRIVEMGVDNWLKIGTEKTPGTKVLSVSGDCKNPGIYEIEWGMNFREFLKLIGAKEPKMIQWSGPSGNALAEEDFDRNISGEDLICGGSVMVFDESRDIFQILKHFSDFFVSESCGICVPCRTGNFLLNKKIDKMISGKATHKDMNDVKEWSKIIQTTSRCGLGQMSSNSLNDAIKKFPEAFRKYMTDDSDLGNKFNLEKSVSEYEHIIKEITTDYE